jgi:hypothetical protein
VLAIDWSNPGAAGIDEGSNNLAGANERLLVCHRHCFAQLQGTYGRDDRHVPRARDHDDVDGRVGRHFDETINSESIDRLGLHESRVPFEDRGDLGAIPRDLV